MNIDEFKERDFTEVLKYNPKLNKRLTVGLNSTLAIFTPYELKFNEFLDKYKLHSLKYELMLFFIEIWKNWHMSYFQYSTGAISKLKGNKDENSVLNDLKKVCNVYDLHIDSIKVKFKDRTTNKTKTATLKSEVVLYNLEDKLIEVLNNLLKDKSLIENYPIKTDKGLFDDFIKTDLKPLYEYLLFKTSKEKIKVCKMIEDLCLLIECKYNNIFSPVTTGNIPRYLFDKFRK